MNSTKNICVLHPDSPNVNIFLIRPIALKYPPTIMFSFKEFNYQIRELALTWHFNGNVRQPRFHPTQAFLGCEPCFVLPSTTRLPLVFKLPFSKDRLHDRYHCFMFSYLIFGTILSEALLLFSLEIRIPSLHEGKCLHQITRLVNGTQREFLPLVLLAAQHKFFEISKL